MATGGKTLTFNQYNTHEAMKWTIIDKKTRLPIDLTGASINVLVKDLTETTTIIDSTATIISPATNGQCSYQPVTGEMDISGSYKVQLTVTFADTTKSIIRNMFIKIEDTMT